MMPPVSLATPVIQNCACHSECSVSGVKNLYLSACHSVVRIAEESPAKTYGMRSLTCVRDDIEIPCRAIALGNDVILTTARRKNLLPSVTASQCNVILKGFALKNLLRNECYSERNTMK